MHSLTCFLITSFSKAPTTLYLSLTFLLTFYQTFVLLHVTALDQENDEFVLVLKREVFLELLVNRQGND